LRHGNRAGIPLLEHGRDCLEAPERELFGHPRGLSVLFATETWERFSYFGNSALVVLYMVQHLLQPGRIEGVNRAAAEPTQERIVLNVISAAGARLEVPS